MNSKSSSSPAGNQEWGYLIPVDVLRTFSSQILTRLGVRDADAATVADALIETDLRGIDTHGVRRLPLYVRRLLKGGMAANPEIRTVSEGQATAVLDGGNGIGEVIVARAMGTAIEKARVSGVGVVGVRNSNHFGTLAYPALLAARHDFIGIALKNANPGLAPWGSVTKLLGSNPWSVAAPGEDFPVVLDIANSVAARSKIKIAAEEEKEIPSGWAMDRYGRITTNPKDAFLLMPLGGHKGYGISFVIEILAGVLTGAGVGPEVLHPMQLDCPGNVGHLVMAIDVGKFLPVDVFKTRVKNLVNLVKGAELAQGVRQVFVPGEKEWLCSLERRRAGIPLRKQVVAELTVVAKDIGLEFPL